MKLIGLPIFCFLLSNFLFGDNEIIFSEAHQKISKLRDNGQFYDLEKFYLDNVGLWEARYDTYGALIVHSLKSLSSGDNEVDSLKHIKRSLAQFDLLSPNEKMSLIEYQIELLFIFIQKTDYRKIELSSEYSYYRLSVTQKIFDQWFLLEKSISNFASMKELPVENVDLPEGVVGFPGMSPDDIQNKEKREQYLEEIRNNDRLRENHNRLAKLRSVKVKFLERIKVWVERMYSMKPHNSTELELLCSIYVSDVELKDVLLNKIRGRTYKK